MPPLARNRPLTLVAMFARDSRRFFGSRTRVGAQRPRGPGPSHAFTAFKRGYTPRRGFTLLEILLCIALIALLGGVLIGGSSHLLSEQPVTPHGAFWKAVQEARKAALKSQREVRLKFDRDKKHFYLVDGLAPSALAADGVTRVEAPLKTFPIPADTAADLTVDFLGASAKGGSAMLVGGVLLESRTIAFVSFYSDGTCTAFRAQFARSGASTILSIDPWTCAPVLEATDPNAPPPT